MIHIIKWEGISYSIVPHFIFELGVFSAESLVGIINLFTSAYKVWSLSF